MTIHFKRIHIFLFKLHHTLNRLCRYIGVGTSMYFIIQASRFLIKSNSSRNQIPIPPIKAFMLLDSI